MTRMGRPRRLARRRSVLHDLPQRRSVLGATWKCPATFFMASPCCLAHRPTATAERRVARSFSRRTICPARSRHDGRGSAATTLTPSTPFPGPARHHEGHVRPRLLAAKLGLQRCDVLFELTEVPRNLGIAGVRAACRPRLEPVRRGLQRSPSNDVKAGGADLELRTRLDDTLSGRKRLDD